MKFIFRLFSLKPNFNWNIDKIYDMFKIKFGGILKFVQQTNLNI